MPFYIVRGDITKQTTDAIVNAANRTLLGGGGVDGAIHRAAGPRLLEECRTLGGCETGEAKLTRGYDLPAGWVIHTVGPIWRGGNNGEKQLLENAYRNSLSLAAEHGFESVAFPLISAGVYGYPKADALRVATETILAFLQTHEMEVRLVLFDRSVMPLREDRYAALQRCLAEAEESAVLQLVADFNFDGAPIDRAPKRKQPFFGSVLKKEAREATLFEAREAAPADAELQELLQKLDESFSEMLLRKIDERGMKDSECYKRANIDRKLFSKIRSNPAYRPRKTTALAFAVALELSLPETKELLEKAGYALSRASKLDVIVEYFIRSGNYNIYEINEALFAFDQALLGG